jgi:hypothetical protein
LVSLASDNLGVSIGEKSGRRANIRLAAHGGIAQLVERLVRNEKARGSNPLTSKDAASCGCIVGPAAKGWSRIVNGVLKRRSTAALQSALCEN